MQCNSWTAALNAVTGGGRNNYCLPNTHFKREGHVSSIYGFRGLPTWSRLCWNILKMKKGKDNSASEPYAGGSYCTHLDLPHKPMPREGFTWYTSPCLDKGMMTTWLSHDSQWHHIIQVGWWQSWYTELEGWFDEVYYRKIKETTIPINCSHIFLWKLFPTVH